MSMEDFFRMLYGVGRYKHDQNLMDRKIHVVVDGKDMAIADMGIDYKGDIYIELEEE